ncbi:MAG: adenylate/guanylate cyclase domain-containing protein [bacterium]|nr:adenylate/guanylate cyclase domain-containing protein [bacterium]
MAKKRRSKFFGLLTVLVTFFIALIVSNISAIIPAFHLLDVLEKKSYDFRFKWRGKVKTEDIPIVIVAADDHSEIALNKRFPYSRDLWAKVIDHLNAAGAKWIVFDIQFATPGDSLEDTELANAIKRAKNVLLAGELIYENQTVFQETTILEAPPEQRFLETGAPWSIVNLQEDMDKVVRAYPAYVPAANGKIYLPLAVRAATLYKKIEATPDQIFIKNEKFQIGNFEIYTKNDNQFFINYFGPTRSFPIYSVAQVLDVAEFDLVEGEDSDWMELFLTPPETLDSSLSALVKENPFRDKIVLIGNTMPAFHDIKATPFDGYEENLPLMSGVEVHAHALGTLLKGEYLRYPVWWIELVAWFMLALLVWWFTENYHIWISSLVLFVTGLVIVAATTMLFVQFRYVFSMITPMVVVGSSFTSSTVLRILREQKEKAEIKSMFGRYVPKKVVGELIANPQLLRLGGEKCNLTILFSDIAGFTSISEKLSPEELVSLLNEYLTAMTRIILEEDGIIDKYEGDLIMAEFGAPVHYKDHAIRACRAAIKMQEKLATMRKEWATTNKPILYSRVGINTGDVIVGNMGSEDVFDYTVMGDAVNLASRLESVNKLYKTNILCSGQTVQQLDTQFHLRFLDRVRVVGKTQYVEIYEVIGLSNVPLPESKKKAIEFFAKGRIHYEKFEYDAARMMFMQALASDPEDGPSKVFLKRCQEYLLTPPPKDWDGVYVITEK